MNISTGTYINRTSPIHNFDARAKIAVLVVFSACTMLAGTWLGVIMCGLFALGCALASRIELTQYGQALRPVLPIAAIILVSNILVALFGLSTTGPAGSALVDPFGAAFTGFILALRIVVLVLGSLVMCLTTTSNELSDAFAWYLKPLRKLHVPVDDIAVITSLTLRFIPMLSEELNQVRAAQASRGAGFETGSLGEKLGAWTSAFIPLFVGTFRRADALAEAMDARCYGNGPRTSLNERSFDTQSYGIALFICVMLVSVAVFF